MEQVLNVVIEHLGPILASLIGALLLFVVRGFTKKYGDKLDIETKMKLDDLLSNLTQQGVALAEQWAKNRNKQLPEGTTVPGNEKLHKAMEFVAEQIRKYNLDELAEAELKDKIEAMLGFGTLSEMPLIEGLPIDTEENDENWNN